MTHYDVLEIIPTASQEVIDAAFRAKAKRLHPDMVAAHMKEWAEEQFKLLNEAHQVLSDPGARAEYDLYLARSCHETSEQRSHPTEQPSAPLRRPTAYGPIYSKVKSLLFSVVVILLAWWIVAELSTSGFGVEGRTGSSGTQREILQEFEDRFVSDRNRSSEPQHVSEAQEDWEIPPTWSVMQTPAGRMAYPPDFKRWPTMDEYEYVVRADVGTVILAGEAAMEVDFDYEEVVDRLLIRPTSGYVDVCVGGWKGRKYVIDGECGGIVIVTCNDENTRFRYWQASTIKWYQVDQFMDVFHQAADYFIALNAPEES